MPDSAISSAGTLSRTLFPIGPWHCLVNGPDVSIQRPAIHLYAFQFNSCPGCFPLSVQKPSKDRRTAGVPSSSGTSFLHSKVSRCPIIRLASVGIARIRAPSLWDGVLNQQNDQYGGCTSKAKSFRPEASSCCSEDVIPVPSGPPPAEPYYLIVKVIALMVSIYRHGINLFVRQVQ